MLPCINQIIFRNIRIFKKIRLTPQTLRKWFACCLAFFFFLPAFVCFPSETHAEDAIPSVLQGWTRWVLDRKPDLSCSLMQSRRACSWLGKLDLKLFTTGGSFQTNVVLEKRDKVPLPGGQEIWPIDVSITDGHGNQILTFVESEERPYLLLPAGNYQISGRFLWKSLPKTLPLPSELAFVNLSLNDKPIENPRILPNGELWLQGAEEEHKAEEDTVNITVSRKLTDGVPFRIDTLVRLRASGKSRELSFGNILPEGAAPISIQSELNYRLDKDWNITLQIRPGVYSIRISALLSQPPTTLRLPKSLEPNWPKTETWSFESNETLRSVEISGASGIDPSRTELPDEWKELPSFLLSEEDTLSLSETRRGEPTLPPNSIALRRHIWLDLNGNGYTVQDQLSGTMHQGWRLNMPSPFKLTRATVNGKDELLTKDVSSNLPGVEIRNQTFQVETVSRLDSPASTFSAVSWDRDVNSLQTTLSTAPGWRLLGVSGVDNDAGTWLSSWRLWDIFLVCLMAITTAKVLGLAWGVVALFALSLSHFEPGAPHYIWINLLLAKALLKVLPEGVFQKIVTFFYFASFALLAITFLPFAIDQIRTGLYPQLLLSWSTAQLDSLIFGPFFMGAAILLGIGVFVLLFRKKFRYAFLSLLASGLCFFLSIISFTVLDSAPFRQNYEQGAALQMNDNVMLSEQNVAAPASLPVSKFSRDELEYGGAVDAEAPAEGKERQKQELLQVDPNAIIQTGSAVPLWNWRNWQFTWNGPVTKEHTITLYLLSPRLNCLLAFVRVILLGALAAAFFNLQFFKVLLSRVTPSIILLGIFFTPDARAQGLPDSSLLKELEERLTRDVCTDHCTTALSGNVNINGDQLLLEFSLSSVGLGAWPIPGPITEFLPLSITLDNANISEFRRSEAGLAWIRVPNGTHILRIKGNLAHRNSLTLQFAEPPKHIEFQADAWEADGLSPFGSIGESLQINRKANSFAPADSGKPPSHDEIALADWYNVNREIRIALPWSITTTVERLGLLERSQIVRIPLIKGESITGLNVRMEGSDAIVTFPRGVGRVEWESSLAEAPMIQLVATHIANITESWRLRCSAIWRCSTVGLAPDRSVVDDENTLEWSPWPNEQLQIEVLKPPGIEGDTHTIDKAILDWTPGSGLLRATLSLALRTSQGGFQKITLPEGAMLEKVSVNNKEVNIALDHRLANIPITPGKQDVHLSWRQNWDESFQSTFPAVDIGSKAENVSINVHPSDKRWILYVSGPEWGPVVLFWGELLVITGIAIFLARFSFAPLSVYQWILLAIGMTTLHPAFLLLPALTFGFLSFRKNHPSTNYWRFNIFQLILILLCSLTLFVLIGSVYNGLIVDPDMCIQGNNSSNYLLSWYIDHGSEILPQPGIYSAPLWSWQVVMLVWSSWLVFALLRWAKWSWDCFSVNGLWKSREDHS